MFMCKEENSNCRFSDLHECNFNIKLQKFKGFESVIKTYTFKTESEGVYIRSNAKIKCRGLQECFQRISCSAVGEKC